MCVVGSRDSHMALWRIGEDDDDCVSSTSFTGRSHWTAGLHAFSDEEDDDDILWDTHAELAVNQLSATPHVGCRRQCSRRPLHVPSYYHMKPLSVKPCEKAEKVRAFAYNDIRQVIVMMS